MNLRKDHCRNLPQQNDPRTRDNHTGRGASRPFVPKRSGTPCRPSGHRPFEATVATSSVNRTPARNVPRNRNQRASPAASDTMCVPASTSCIYPKRLSATDISALASMKNVAKCDTWCELQNPVNHRVFERKLRPTPFGRGHVCLGVTHRCPQTPPASQGARDLVWRRKLASRGPVLAVSLKRSPRRRAPRQSVVDETSVPVVRVWSPHGVTRRP